MVIRQMINRENIFHCCYKGRVLLRRDFPVFTAVRLKFAFFKIRCAVTWETEDANLSSTALSARSLTVQRAWPSGASEQARAVSRASNSPSKTTARGGVSLFLRSRAASSPSSTNRFFMCSMVREVTPSALATLATVHTGPCAPVSHSNNARALIIFFVPVFPLRVKASSSARSDSINVTLYRGATATSFGCHDYVSFFQKYEILNVT